MAEDDQTESETKKPRSRGTQPTDRTMTATAQPAATGGAQPRFQMPWDRQGGGWGGGQQPAAPNGNTGVVGPGQAQGGQQMPWGGGGGFQPGGIMGGQGQGQMPNWQALAQQFAQRFSQNNPFLQRLGMTGQGQMPPGQAPAAPPQGQPMPGRTPPFYAGAQVAQGQTQPGAAPQQGGAFAPQIQRLAQMFGRQQPGGIVGPGQGPQGGQGY